MADQNGFAEWGGYMDAKITKLEEQYSAASAPFRKSNLFAGISIYVNGLTDPSSDELKRIMMVHGGTFHHYERSHTTYIIASNLPDVKVRNMDTSKIISAKWVVDCVAANRILDYTQYLLYTNQKTTQPCLNFGKAKKDPDFANKSRTEKVEKILEDLKVLNEQMLVNTLNKSARSDVNSDKDSKPPNVVRVNNISTSSNTARTAVDPNFLPEFYNNSRLHHIATLGAGFKQYVTELREKHDESIGFPARSKLRELLKAEELGDFESYDSTFIMHIDMDCFFVSVGLRKHPHLRGCPVAVTHSKGGTGASDVPVHPAADRAVEKELFAKRFEQKLHNNILAEKVTNGFDAKMSLSEIASCSYEARKKGIQNGMFVGQAIKMCPELKTIPYDFEGYREVAFTLYDTIAQYTLQIEAVSCDEMFVELSDIIRELKIPPMEFVRIIRDEVRQKTGCPCSAGVGANKLQARMATKRAKPDGQYHLEVNDVEAYMAEILAEELPGVGSSTNYILKNAGYTTCGDLQRLTLARLQGLVGKKNGETLYQFCRGIDNRTLAYEQIRKSVSAEVNYGIRFKEYSELEKFLRQLSAEVHSRLCQIKRKTKCVTLKVMVRAKEAPVETSKFMGHGVCDHITKSIPLSDFTNDVEVITRSVLTAMKNLKLPPNELRGIGIQLTKLDEQKAMQEPKKNVILNMFNKMNTKRKEEENPDCLEFKILGLSSKETKNREEEEKIPKEVPGYIELVKFSPTESNQKKRPNVLDMLQVAHIKRQKPNMKTDNTDAVTLPSYIDAEVFEALPLNIRGEILQELAYIKNKQSSTSALPKSKTMSDSAYSEFEDQPSTSRAALDRRTIYEEHGNNTDLLKGLPLNMRNDIETSMPELCSAEEHISNDNSALQTALEQNIFLQPNCKQLLLEWVKSDITPREYDVQICRDDARNMVRANKLSALYAPLMHLRKVIENKYSVSQKSPWLKAYCDVLEEVHDELNLLYSGRELLTPDTKLL